MRRFVDFGGGGGGGGSGTPGGANTNVQFNEASSFGGDAEMVWNTTLKKLTISANVSAPGVSDEAALAEKQWTLGAANSNILHGLYGNVKIDQAGYNATHAVATGRGVLGRARALGATGTVTGLIGVAGLIINDGAGAVTNGYAFYALPPENTGGGSLGSVYGLYVPAQATGTSIFGVHLNIAAAANRWNLYVPGTAENYLAAALGIGTSTPHASSLLDLTTTTKGCLLPRMTSTQRLAISSPATGLQVFDTTLGDFVFWTGTIWSAFHPAGKGAAAGRPAAALFGRIYYISDAGDERLTRDTGSAWEDLTTDWDYVSAKPSTFAPAAHGTNHNPGGSDAATTAAPVSVGTANAESTATSFARAAHVHAPMQVQALGTVSTNQIIDFSLGRMVTMTIAANIQISLTSLGSTVGATVWLKLIQDATGGRVPTWGGTNLDWPGGASPPLSSVGLDVDYLEFLWDGLTFVLVNAIFDAS